VKTIAVIPARYESTRFPGKLLANLKGKPVIQYTYENVKKSGLFEDIIIATDDERIRKAVGSSKAKVIMTRNDHKSGTDRISEACSNLDFDLVVNVQGDEPFIDRDPLSKLIEVFSDPEIEVASLMSVLNRDHENPNIVKVVCDKDNFALYFSRSLIPYDRDKTGKAIFHQHIGVYAFRRKMLFEFVKLPLGYLERVEKLEQLRLLENGFRIKMVETNYHGTGIDTPEDLARAEREFG